MPDRPATSLASATDATGLGQSGPTSVEAFLCAFARGEEQSWPPTAGHAFASGFLERARYHGVLPLVHDRLEREPGAAKGWPQAVLQACREDALGLAMWELRHRDVLRRVLAQLATINARPVLFKGTALAHSVYPPRALRVRGDTDLIVPPAACDRVTSALEALGFRKQVDAGATFVFYQASYIRRDEDGGTHVLDVHWRINNSQLLSRLFDHQELLQNARPVPRLGPEAWAAGSVDALLLACMHRATHYQSPYYVDGAAYYGGDRLIWLYDIHLLAGSLSADDWNELTRLAREKGLLAVCLEGLERARARFHTSIPEGVLAALRLAPPEAVARYLRGGVLRQQWMDLCAIAGTGNKLWFLGESLFPPASYMRQRYPQERPDWLPWLYLKRVCGGAVRRMLRHAGR